MSLARLRLLALRGAVPLVLVLVAGPATRAQPRPAIRWQAGGHSAGVDRVAWSPDGMLVASASDDGTGKVWDPATARLRATFALPDFYTDVHSIAFTPDGTGVVITGTGGAYRFNLDDAALAATYCCLETGYATAFSPDGQFIAVGGSQTGSEEATLLMTLDGQLVDTFIFNAPHYVAAVAFTPDGTHVITGAGTPFSGGGNAGVIRYWRISDGMQTLTLTGHTKRVNALAISPDGAVLASASSDASLRLWNATSGAFIRTLPGHTGEVTGVSFAPDGLELASSAADGTVRVWDPASGALLRTLTGHAGPVGDVAWSPGGGMLVTGGGQPFALQGDATLRSWTAAGDPLELFTHQTSQTESVAVSGDGQHVAVGEYTRSTLYSAAEGSVVGVFPTLEWALVVALSHNGSLLAMGTYDGTVELWRVSDGALVHTLTGHTSYVEGLAFSPDDQYIAAGDWDGPVKVWRTDSGVLAHEYSVANIGARAIGFAADGSFIAIGGGSTVQLRTFPAGAVFRTLTGHTSAVLEVAVAPDGSQLVSGGSDRTARIWDAASGTLLHTLEPHIGWVQGVAWSPDRRFIATGTRFDDRRLRLWDAATGTLLVGYEADMGAGIASVRFLPDNHGLALARADGTVLVLENPYARAPGDLDCDGAANFGDINPFVLALLGEPGYLAEFPGCNWLNADVNGDGQVGFGDINAFVALLTGLR